MSKKIKLTPMIDQKNTENGIDIDTIMKELNGIRNDIADIKKIIIRSTNINYGEIKKAINNIIASYRVNNGEYKVEDDAEKRNKYLNSNPFIVFFYISPKGLCAEIIDCTINKNIKCLYWDENEELITSMCKDKNCIGITGYLGEYKNKYINHYPFNSNKFYEM